MSSLPRADDRHDVRTAVTVDAPFIHAGRPAGTDRRTEQKPFRMGNVSEWRGTTDAGFGGDAPVKPMKQLHITTGSRCMAT